MKVRGMEKREVIVDIICDRCKKSCKLSDSLGNISYAELNAKWPYGSYKDTEHHQLHLCEKCYDWLRKLLKRRRVSVRVSEYDLMDGVSRFD